MHRKQLIQKEKQLSKVHSMDYSTFVHRIRSVVIVHAIPSQWCHGYTVANLCRSHSQGLEELRHGEYKRWYNLIVVKWTFQCKKGQRRSGYLLYIFSAPHLGRLEKML